MSITSSNATLKFYVILESKVIFVCYNIIAILIRYSMKLGKKIRYIFTILGVFCLIMLVFSYTSNVLTFNFFKKATTTDAIARLNEVGNFQLSEFSWIKRSACEKKITVLKNLNHLLPLSKLDKKIVRISIGNNTAAFRLGLERFGKIDHYQFSSVEEAEEQLVNKLGKYDVVITAFHASSSGKEYGMPKNWRRWLKKLPSTSQNALVIFGNPKVLKKSCNLKKVDAVVLGFENKEVAMERMSQFIYGAIVANGKLPFTVSKQFPINSGIKVESTGRLKFSQPEELGIDPKKFAEVDRLAKDGIKKGAFPGCQIVVAVEGKIIYKKSFGTQRYEDSIKVKDTDVYDIASVTKIAGSTMAIMKLESEGKFSIDKKIKDYLPELTSGSPFGDILLKDMMTHQAGLTAWIPFYKRTMKEGELNPEIYSKEKKEGFENQVAKGIWIKNSYTDSIYKRILNSELGPKKYEYSDLGYYFIKKIVEKQSNQNLDEYLLKNLYEPMGLQYMRYRPLNYFPLSQIVPTEKDMAFRKQQVHGYVHDPGAAMLGGVGGHAGLFSNATDLASLMQLLLNKGTYGETSYINKSVVDLYTKCQFCPTNRRGIGFDRPKNSGGGTCHEVASQSSFGHSGFTGTLAWADPEYQINYVFLSNRVYQDQDNWKIRDMNIRTNIQKAIYDAVLSAKKL